MALAIFNQLHANVMAYLLERVYQIGDGLVGAVLDLIPLERAQVLLHRLCNGQQLFSKVVGGMHALSLMVFC